MSDETGVGAAAAMNSTHPNETDPGEGKKQSTTTKNLSAEDVGNNDGKKGMVAAAAEKSAEPGGSGMEAANPGGMGNESEAEQEALAASLKGTVKSATVVATSEPKGAAAAVTSREWGKGSAKEEEDEEEESDQVPKITKWEQRFRLPRVLNPKRVMVRIQMTRSWKRGRSLSFMLHQHPLTRRY